MEHGLPRTTVRGATFVSLNFRCTMRRPALATAMWLIAVLRAADGARVIPTFAVRLLEKQRVHGSRGLRKCPPAGTRIKGSG
ncbi:hypothetical protein KUF71_018320 [Frankliniella fusca]|uniref:Uncharacterized protein n=1 Tax=Frankliniella fusca TaxID=407009 RepID=A0AAE1L6H6_9NEOP|nr:hypothetical protein KUF71_018320 [Frankliniella fusca]